MAKFRIAYIDDTDEVEVIEAEETRMSNRVAQEWLR